MLKLLIVDDQKGIRRLLTEVFKEFGCLIQSCANGLQSLEIIPQFNPDLIILDVKMPGMNGIDVIKKIRETNQEMKIILMTAYGDQHYINQAKALDVAQFVSKPFDLNELKEKVRDIFREKDYQIGS